MAEKKAKEKGKLRRRIKRRKTENDVPYVGDCSDENEEQLREGPRRGFYLIPNLLTSSSLMLGFYSLSLSFGAFINPRAEVDYFFRAAWALFAAMIFDGLDGRVARLTRTTSSFGLHFDSLADLVSFGIAPAALIYNFALRWGTRPGLGWAVAFLFIICGAMRLARFNITTESLPKDVFQGLAIPAAASVPVFSVLLFLDMEWVTEQGTAPVFWPFVVLMVALALLMVSTFKYPNFKSVNIHKRRPFGTFLFVVVLLIIVFEEPAKTLFLAAVIYALSAPVKWCFTRWRTPATPLDAQAN